MQSFFARSLCAAIAVMLLAGPARADQWIDNFNDGNYVAESLNNSSWQGDITDGDHMVPAPGFGMGVRSSTSLFWTVMATSNKDANLSGVPGAYEYAYGMQHTGYSAIGYGINPSTASSSAPERRYQSIGLDLATTATGTVNMTANSHRYLRLTAYRRSSDAHPAGSVFLVTMTGTISGTCLPASSSGPWSSDGLALEGFPVTTTPRAYILDYTNTDRFKVDPVYQTISDSLCDPAPNCNVTAVAGIYFGYRRVGADALASMSVRFTIDDVMMLQNLPAINTATTNTATVDRGDSRDITVSLTAMPSHDVTISASSSDTGVLTVAPASLTFTPANWSTPQSFTVTGQNIAVAPQPAIISFTRTTNDLYYANEVPATSSIPFTVVPVSVSRVEIGG